MKNIVIYAERKESQIAEFLEQQLDDANIRVEEDYTLKEYETLNPSLIIAEKVKDLSDVLALVKFKTPILFVGEDFRKASVVRAFAYDFIRTPLDMDELLIRVKSMLRIRELMAKIRQVSTTDELTGLHLSVFCDEIVVRRLAVQ